jgi:hypothetical protein
VGSLQHLQDGLGLQRGEGLLNHGARIVTLPGQLLLGMVDGKVRARVGQEGDQHDFLRTRQGALEHEADEGAE